MNESNDVYITTIQTLSFHPDHVRIIGSMECGNTRCYYFQDNMGGVIFKLKKYYAGKSSERTGI